jgi:hypothetical protein
MVRRGAPLVVALLSVCAATSAVAQGPTVTNPPNSEELGIDAGAVFGLGSPSSVQITLPAARARIGFFLNNNSRWSLEPAAFLSYSKVSDAPGVFLYDLEAGALYHFRTPSDVYTRTHASVAYVRPFVGVAGSSGGGTSSSEFSAGAGLGVKIPWRPYLAWRLEANAGYGFKNDAFRIGAFAGLSFFTRGLM